MLLKCTCGIQRIISGKRPEQLKMDFFLWSRAAVGQLIEQKNGIKLPVRSVGKQLARWGFSWRRGEASRLLAQTDRYAQQCLTPLGTKLTATYGG